MHGHFLWELTGTWSQFTKKRRIIADRRSHIILHFPWSFLMDIVTAIYWWPSPAFQRWIPERYRIWNKKKTIGEGQHHWVQLAKKRKTRSEPDDNVSRENGRRRISGCRSFANRVKSEPPRWIDSRWFDPFGRENRENPKRWPAGVAALSLDLAFIDRS